VPKFSDSYPKIAILALLCLVTLAAFWPLTHSDFINFDDPLYVTDQPRIAEGLSAENVLWAFTTPHPAENWQPATTISYLLDVQVFGPQAFGHHLTNLLIHLANTLILLFLLNWLTGYFWRSAIIAALFALHPMHVEAVAWISSRKDVLCTFFFMLSIWAYGRYANCCRPNRNRNCDLEHQAGKRSAARPGPQQQQSQLSHPDPVAIQPVAPDVPRSVHWLWYSAALAFFAAALMSKAMAVTLPFVLLLLDCWPLGRATNPETERKVSGNAQSNQGSRSSPSPMAGPAWSEERAGERRSPLYCGPIDLRRFLLLVCEKIPFFVLTIIFSWLASSLLRKEGATQNYGELSFSDRAANGIVSYARYLGKLIWPADLSVFYPRPAHWPIWYVLWATLLITACSILAIGSIRKRPYVFTGWFWFLGTMVPVVGIIYQIGAHSMADRHTYLPYTGLFILVTFACAEISQRESVRRIFAGAAALVIVALGIASRTQVANWQNSETLFRHAIAADRNNDVAHELLGLALAQEGKLEEAELNFAEALRIKPDFRMAKLNLAVTLARNGRIDEGISRLYELLKQYPNDQEAHYNLGMILQQKGDVRGAVEQYQQALRLKPDDADALNNLAWIRAANPDASLRNGEEAVRLAQRACELTRFQKPVMIGTLAAAYAEAGRVNEAIAAAKKAQDLAIKLGLNEVAEKNARLCEFYQAGKAYHE
jgi:Flp pilus assembly protein TadD